MFKLKFTNPWSEVFFFANLGLPWPADPTKRMIERTVTKAEHAREFATAEEAREILVQSGNKYSKQWEVVDGEGKVVA